MLKGPCLDCQDRKVGCHSVCEKYMAFKTESDRQNAQLSVGWKNHMMMTEVEKARNLKIKKRRRVH